MATPAQQMFAVAPATGAASLTGEQKQLLVGKARWISAVAEAGQPVVPTICISRAAWQALQDERTAGETKLRTAWVATLYRLVRKDDPQPPTLVVRTSAKRHSLGLMRARTGIAAPARPGESVDPDKPLARAINEAFASYESGEPVWVGVREQVRRDQQIVIVQAMADGAFLDFSSRNLQTGEMGPAPLAGERLQRLPPNAADIALVIDRTAGTHMTCLVAVNDGHATLVSARMASASAAAELEAAVDRVHRDFWSPRDAVMRVDAERLPQVLHPHLAGGAREPLASGIGVSPGAASGEIVFTAEDAARVRARGKHCILVAIETGPGDIDGMQAATGILTARGGQNSHAAIIARVSGKACVAGVRALNVDLAEMTCRIGETTLKAGQKITIDGTDGAVFAGALPLSQPHIGGAIGSLLDWSDASRTVAVRTNVETVDSADTALSFGAEGIGLARSEHMFFTPERMIVLRRMILSENQANRMEALEGLVEYQADDYAALFEIMNGRPVNVRLFDPPLHEFLPRTEEDIVETGRSLGVPIRNLRQRLERLAEVNPMLGHRGCRLAITYPEILEMQVHALIAGARAAAKRTGVPTRLEIMVPFVTSPREVGWLKTEIDRIVQQERTAAEPLDYRFGTMIELPRAALRAGEIAPLVDFFSFGTNDLTQTTYGISRDDAPAFLATYKRKGVYDEDPFATLDQRGVGELIRMAIERGRTTNPDLNIGICGEHAGDPASIRFFAGLGIDYISCSPYRVPVARLALAQAEQQS